MPETDSRFSGSKIREARHAAGLTQAALARAINTRERNIIRWENDQHEPRFENVAAIAKATDRPLEFFSAAATDAGEDDDEEADLAVDLLSALRRFVREELSGRTR
jgi:transcriptional regulator with XRE-family HTH domain